jgi:hypothetical protein
VNWRLFAGLEGIDVKANNLEGQVSAALTADVPYST